MSLYCTNVGNDAHPQGLIIDEETGRNVAVVYDRKDMAVLAAGPDMRVLLSRCAESLADYENIIGLPRGELRREIEQLLSDLTQAESEG